MLVVRYTVTAGCGLLAGWFAAHGQWLPLVATIAVGVVVFGSLLVYRARLDGALPGNLSPAHRAWFASSAACALALVSAWLVFGISLPSLKLDGISLDPAGALGWTRHWLAPRLEVALWLLALGATAMLFPLGSWAWQKYQGRKPVVLASWALAPFFWMASLGLLAGVSSPWRQAASHPLATQWAPDLPAAVLVEMADDALAMSEKDSAAAVWAHALGLRAYQEGQFDRQRLDEYFRTLASSNAKRSSPLWFPSASVVGVDAASWCRAQLARDPRARNNWASSQKSCQVTSGRKWNWSAL